MKNQRKHPRVSFSVEDGIVARFLLKETGSDLQTAYVLNLSEGGLFFMLRTDQNNLLRQGDYLQFVEIKKWRSMQFLVNIQADVVWKGDIPEEKCIGVGCKFRNISERNLKNIKDLVGERIIQGMEIN